jgi:phosphate starvation-inducible PhoH-like protein
MVVTGDITQIDLPRKRSGLADIERILSGVDSLAFAWLSGKDVVRHKLVQRIVEAYRQYEETQTQTDANGPAHQTP